MQHTLHTLLVALILILTLVVWGSPLDNFNSGERSAVGRSEPIEYTELQSRNDLSLINHATSSPGRLKPIVREEITSLVPVRRTSTPQPGDFIHGSLQRRGIRTVGGLTYRYLQAYIIDPVTEGFRTLGRDLDAAFASYKKVSESLKADHPPLFQLNFTYGSWQLILTCGNPLNVAIVRDILDLLTFATMILGTVWLRLSFWSVTAGAIMVILALLPQQPGRQNMIP